MIIDRRKEYEMIFSKDLCDNRVSVNLTLALTLDRKPLNGASSDLTTILVHALCTLGNISSHILLQQGCLY